MIDTEIRALPECQYLIEELGGEDVVEKEVNSFIETFQGLVQFKAGVYQKAVEHGWKPPAKAIPQISHFSNEFLETRNWRWNKDGTKAYASLSVTAKVVKIGLLDAYEYENQEGDSTVQRYVDVTLEDCGIQEVVRMKDLEGFTSRDGKDVAASAMATLWHNLRAAEGRTVKISGLQVTQSTSFDGETRYDFSSGNFTRVVKVLPPDVTEEDFDGEDW